MEPSGTMKEEKSDSVTPASSRDTNKTPSEKSSGDLTTLPDGGWGWVVVFASFMIHFIVDGITYTFGIFIIELMEVFGEGRGTVSLIPSTLSGVTFCVGPIASALINHSGCRLTTIIGSILAASGLAVSAITTNVFTLYVALGLCTGLGFGLIYLPAIVSVSMYFEKKRAFATGIAVCGSGLGTSVMAPLIHKVIDWYGWENALVALGGIVLLCVPISALFKPIQNNSTAISTNIEAKEQTIIKAKSLHDAKSYECSPSKVGYYCHTFFAQISKMMIDVDLMYNLIFIMFALSNFMSNIGLYVPYFYTMDRALQMGIEKEDASFLLTVIGVANILGRIVLGYVSDRPWINRLYTYNISLAICGLTLGISTFCSDYAGQAVYCAVFGVTSGAYIGLIPVVLVDLLGLDRLTNALGLVNLFQGIAIIIGPPIIGALYDAIGNYDSGFYFSGLMIFISGIMLFALPLMERDRVKNRSGCENQDITDVGEKFKKRYRKKNLIFAFAQECKVSPSKNLDTNAGVPAQSWDSRIPGTFPVDSTSIAIIGTRGGRRDDT